MSRYTHEFYSMEVEYYKRRYIAALERITNSADFPPNKSLLKRVIFAGLGDKFAYDAMSIGKTNREINDIMMHLRALEKIAVRLL